MQDRFQDLATRYVDIDQRIADAAEMVKSFLEKSWKPQDDVTYTKQTLDIESNSLGYDVRAVTHYKGSPEQHRSDGTAFDVRLNKDGSFQVPNGTKRTFDIFSHQAEDLAIAIIIDLSGDSSLANCHYDYDQGIQHLQRAGMIKNARISAKEIVAEATQGQSPN